MVVGSDNPDKQEWPTLRWPDAAEVIGEGEVGGTDVLRVTGEISTSG